MTKDPKSNIFLRNSLEIIRDSFQKTEKFTGKEVVTWLNVAKEQIVPSHRELKRGEALEFNRRDNLKETQAPMQSSESFRARLFEEERILIETRTRELRLQIEAIKIEVKKLASITPDLSQEIQIAAFQSTADVSSYQLFFLKELFKFIKDFREKIEKAAVWLNAVNKRSKKRTNVWGQNYKKYGGKYLLSGEHYSQRASA